VESGSKFGGVLSFTSEHKVSDDSFNPFIPVSGGEVSMVANSSPDDGDDAVSLTFISAP
jgi:hypothetical protein